MYVSIVPPPSVLTPTDCPRDLFPHHPSLFGPCLRVHEKQLQDKYRASVISGGRKYDRECEEELLRMVRDVDARIEKVMAALETPEPTESYLRDRDVLAAKIHEINALAAEIDGLLSNQKVVEAASALEQLMKLNQEKDALERTLERVGVRTAGRHQTMTVCKKCGAGISIFDTDVSLECHYEGEMHAGIVRLRHELKQS
ncbi:splicing factor [Irineochytrium annulatum]|nr:splicing factor [Irineochytrium annulatum]